MLKIVCVSLTSLLNHMALAQTEPVQTSQFRKVSQDSITGMRPIETFELPNGLSIIAGPDTGLKQVSLRLWYRVGSLHEVKRKTGSLHLFEHLMLKVSRFAPGGALAFERTMGADVTATTRYKSTDFNMTVMPEKVDEVLRFYSDG